MTQTLPGTRNSVALAHDLPSHGWLRAFALLSGDKPNWFSCRISSVLLLGLVAILASGCAEERGLPPTTPEYDLFVTAFNSDSAPVSTGIDVINLETRTVRARIETSKYGTMRTTADGRYLITFRSSSLAVFDVSTLQMISSVPIDAHEFAVQSNPPVVVTSKFLRSIVVYGLPNLDTLAVFLRPRPVHILPSSVPGEVLVIGLRDPSGTPRPTGPLQLLRISLTSGDVLDSIEFISPETQGGVTTNMWSFYRTVGWNTAVTLSPDGSRLYMAGLDDAGPALFCFDVNTGNCLFRTPGLEWEPYISADGREVWVMRHSFSWPENSTTPLGRVHLLFLDASNGQILDSLQISGLISGLSHVAFHPDRPEAYVSAGYSPGLLIINTMSRSVLGTMYDSVGMAIEDGAIAPRF